MPGRTSLEPVSGAIGSQVSFRIAEIAVPQAWRSAARPASARRLRGVHLRAQGHRHDGRRERRDSDQARRHRADPAEREAHDAQHRQPSRWCCCASSPSPMFRRAPPNSRASEILAMSNRVLCLRPEADFARVDAAAPKSLQVAYHAPDDAAVAALMKSSDALVIPAVGPKLAPELFEGASLKLVQVTGAGVDRLDQAALTRLGIPVANVPGGSNSAVAEYAVTAASMLLRRFAWADAEIKAGNYAKFRARMVARQSRRHRGLQVGLIGFGTIGRAVAQALRPHRAPKVCYLRSGAADARSGIDARADVAGRTACNLRRGVAACAAACRRRRT